MRGRSPSVGVVAVALGLVGLAAPAAAHTAAMSSLEVHTDGRDVAVSFIIDATSVVDLIARGGDGAVAKSEVASHTASVLRYLDARFTVGNAGAPCRHGAPVRLAYDARTDKVALDLRYHCDGALTRLDLRSTLFHDEATPHQVIGTVRHGPLLERYFFTRGEQSAQVDLTHVPMPKDGSVGSRQFRMAAPPPGAFAQKPSTAPTEGASASPGFSVTPSFGGAGPAAPSTEPGSAAGAGERAGAGDVGAPEAGQAARPMGRGVVVFIGEGIRHILGGFDHLLFLLSLLVAVDGWRRFAAVVSSFTLAHSLTLALGALELVSVSPRLVEPLIAASIIYVAVENVARARSHARAAVTFGFGLVHGLGFSGVLRDLGLAPSELISPLLGFNIGVELGQLVVVAPLLPVVLWLQGKAVLHRRVRIVCGVVVGALAAVWFVERVLAARA